MKKLAEGVYLEDSYPGVLLGAVVSEQGTIMIDAPLRPDDGRAWQNQLRALSKGADRLLVSLDAHPDRTLGTRIMDSAILSHKATSEIFKQRPAVFKGQNDNSGAEWENCSGLSGLRWLHPHLVYTEQVQLHWLASEVLVKHFPGPESGASWLLIPDQKILFVGDAVVMKQPPFLANANLPAWLDTLNMLLSKEYKDYKIISSRGRSVNEKNIRNMRKALSDLHRRLERMSKRRYNPEDTKTLIPKLLTTFESPAKYKLEHTQRLSYGLQRYFQRTYFPSSSSSD